MSQLNAFWAGIIDRGSYLELGFQRGTQRDLLSSTTLTSDGITPPACSAKSATTIASCFAGYTSSKSPSYIPGFQIDGTTKLAMPAATETLHRLGAYWVFISKAIPKRGAGKTKGGADFGGSTKSNPNAFLEYLCGIEGRLVLD